MGLRTKTDVDEVEAVQDRNGDYRPAADADKQQATNDRLGNQPGVTQFVHTTSSTAAEALPSKAVPHGVTVLVEYKEGNAGNVYLGDSDTQESPLAAVGDGRTYPVDDTSAVYVRAATSGDAVVVTFES